MAKIKSANDGKEAKVKDGSAIKPACEEIGVPFGCQDGICGVCTIEIVEGEDNLQPLNERETSMGCDKKKRLACQCKINKGDVTIKF